MNLPVPFRLARPLAAVASCGATLLLCLAGGQARAQSCKPDFGERMLGWAENGAGAQSRALAESDYAARTFSYMLTTFEQSNAQLTQASRDLDAVAERIRAEEASPDPDAVLAAVTRERNATALQNALYRIRTQLDETSARHRRLLESPTRERFIAEGHHNVGRATLLASFQEIGNAAHASLPERYGVVVQTTYHESTGGFETEVQPTGFSGDMYDAAAALAAHYAGPYGPAVYFTYVVGRSEYDSSVCRKRMREQEALLKRAVERLPDVLIQPEEQFALYERLYAERKQRFAEHSRRLQVVQDDLDARWRGLFASNALRVAAANAVLTTAKVDALRRRYGGDDRVTRMFDAMGRAEVHAAATALHDFVVGRQTRVLTACGDVDGFALVEDQRDALAYAAASYRAFQKQAAFAPLEALFDQRLRTVEAASQELEALSRTLPGTACPTFLPPVLSPGRVASSKKVGPAPAKSALRATGASSRAARARAGLASIVLQPGTASEVGFCIMTSLDGRTYGCGAGQGSPYAGRFAGGAQDPRVAVLGRAFDGGFREDRRGTSRVVQDAIANIDARIAYLREAVQGPVAALPRWREANATALQALARHAAQERTRELGEQTSFRTAHAAEVQAAAAYVDEFLSVPGEGRRASVLLRRVDAADLTLPDLPAAAVLPGAPALPGVTAAQRAYGGVADPQAQRIEREHRKLEHDLAGQPGLGVLAREALDDARRFAGRDGGARVVEELLKDSAAARFFGTGARPRLELAALDAQGRWTRVAVGDPAQLPADTLLAQVAAFRRTEVGYGARAEIARGTLDAGDPQAPKRARVLSASDRLAAIASETFFSGELAEGRALLHYATRVLDLAVSLTPGVGWARDVYEAVSGADLLSGETLDGLGRVTAVIGVVSGGFGDDAFDALRTLRKLDFGVTFPRAERVLEASRRMRPDNLHYTEYARYRQQLRQIPQDRIDDAITRGDRYWDTQERSIVAYEANVPEGRSRVAIAIDPDAMSVRTVMKVRERDAQIMSKLYEGKPRYRRLLQGQKP